MQLTRQTDYALRLLMYLSVEEGQGWVRVQDISEAYGISHHHMLKVARALGAGGFVSTKRGVAGGVRLARRPSEMTVGEVVRALEPQMAIVECMQTPPGACVIHGACGLETALRRAREAFLEVIDSVSLAECAHRREPLARLLGLRSG